MQKKAELKIYGEVQGVFFRARTCEIAKNLGLTGWVKNEADGSVKIIAEGEETVLKLLIERCYTIPSARVERIEVEWKKRKGIKYIILIYDLRFKNYET